ncbi:hypothetical protein KC946_00520 [Candidatus Saccharibacteria bacterium]|nr:hypothetical protein [Candidatus Saccharibacteria bacterium]
MYFTNRVDAGKQMAEQLLKYKEDNCTLVALSDGAVVVALQIANKLECPITMLLTEPIEAPGETQAVASIDQAGGYSHNSSYSAGQHQELDMEYHHLFEQKKMEKMTLMHQLIGHNELINKKMLKHHTIILVSDGLGSVSTLDAAALFLKSIKYNKLIIVTPFASVDVVDRMHILGDDLLCLSTISNFMGTNHYYDENAIPDHSIIVSIVQNIVRDWKHKEKPRLWHRNSTTE